MNQTILSDTQSECSNLEEIENLASERQESTCEVFTPNDFYGHATLLKKYAGLPPEMPLPGVVPHGISLSEAYWEPELTCPLRWIYAPSEEQKSRYAHRTNKSIHLIGSIFHYAEQMMLPEVGSLREGARGTVVFPAHSTHFLTSDYDLEEFTQALLALPDCMHPITICMYWRDIQLKRHLKYMEAGFHCQTAGHMFDPDFHYRLMRIISGHRHMVTNQIGSSSLMAASLGLSVHLFEQFHQILGEGKYLKEYAPKVTQPSAVQLLESMRVPVGESIPDQKPWGDIATGRSFVRTPEQLREMIMEHAVDSVEKSVSKPFSRTWDQEMERLKQSSRWAPDPQGDTILPEGNVFHFVNGHRLLEEHEIWNMEGVFPDLSQVEQPVILDCGSDTGYTIVRMAKKWPKAKIYGFEVNFIKTKMLYRNLDAFGLQHVLVGGKAVWIESGKVAFETNEPGIGSHVCQIGAVRLRDFLGETKVDILRLNIANAILPVVQDCGEALRQARHIIVNYPSEETNRQELIALMTELSALGYQLQIKQAQPLDGSETITRILMTAVLAQ